MPAKYSFDEYRQALAEGAFTPEQQAELFTAYPELKYDKNEVLGAINDGAFDEKETTRLASNFPELGPAGGILSGIAAAPALAYQATKEGLYGQGRQLADIADIVTQRSETGDLGNVAPLVDPMTGRAFETSGEPTAAAGVSESMRQGALEAQKAQEEVMRQHNIQPGTLGSLAANVGSSIGQSTAVALPLVLGGPAAGAAGAGVLGAIAGGQRYNQAREAGYDVGEAGAQNALFTLAEAVPEYFGTDYILESVKDAGKKAGILKSIAKAMGTNAVDESVTQVWENAVQIAANRPGVNETAPTITQGVGEAALAGAVAGGLMGGGGAITSKIFERNNNAPAVAPAPAPITTEQTNISDEQVPQLAAAALNEQNAGEAPGTSPEPVAQENVQATQQAPASVPETRPATLSVDEINQSPELQFKRNVDKNLVTDKLKGRKFSDLLAGSIDVFVNPEDGKTYVWNGNHRLVNAIENGRKDVKVTYSDFANMEEARAAAILKNLAENNGEPLDYRNFFREAGEQDFEALKKVMADKGIDISKGMATKGFALSKLNDYLTNEYERGNLPENVAVEIGKQQLSDADQNALYQHIKSRYLENKVAPNNGQVRNLIEFAKSAPKSEGEADLFGNSDVINQMSIKSEVADYIGNLIKKDKNMLKKLSNEDLAAAATERNIGELKTDQAATEAQKAAVAEMYFKKRMFAAGDEISGALNTATQRIIDGEPVNKVKAETFLGVRKILESEGKNGPEKINAKPASVEQSIERSQQQPIERNTAPESVAPAAQPVETKVKIADIKSIEELAHRQKDISDAKVTSIEGADRATVNYKGRDYAVTETPTGLKYDEIAAPEAPAKQEGLFEEDMTSKERDQKATRATEDLFQTEKIKTPSGDAFAAPIKSTKAAAVEEVEAERPAPTPHEHHVAGIFNSLNRVELVQLAEDILNSIPTVARKLRGDALGRFYHVDESGKGKIKLDASKLKEADFQYISDVLAHEIGHAIDWREGKVNNTLSRGNVLGHLAALAKYLKTTINLEPDGKPEYLTSKERAKIRREAKSRVAEMGFTRSDNPEAYSIELSHAYQELIQEYLDDNNLISREMAKMEMLDLTQQWWGLSDEEMNNEKYLAYVSKPSELYANTFGAFLTNPGFLFETAPTVANMLYDYMKKKPATLKLYQYFQQRINSGNRIADNLDYIRRKMMDADTKQAEALFKARPKGNLTDWITSAVVDNLSPLLKYAGVAPGNESAMVMLDKAQKLRSLGDIVEAHLKSFLPEIDRAIKENNIDITDLGLKAYFERIVEERSKEGIIDLSDAELTKKLNAELEKNYSPDQVRAMTDIFGTLHEARSPLIQKLVDLGIFTAALAKKLANNKSYFTFDIVDHYNKELGAGNSVSARIHKQIGTLKVSANPFVSTIMKDIALVRLATEMDFTKQAIKFLPTAGIDVKPAQYNFTLKRNLTPNAASNLGLVEVLEGGKLKGYYVPKDIADAMNNPTIESNVGTQTLSAINGFSRALFTEANPGFIVSNAIRDSIGSFIKLPHTLTNFGTFSKILMREIWRAVTNTQDKGRILELMKEGGLYGDRSRTYKPDSDASTYMNILQKYGIADANTFKSEDALKYLKVLKSLQAAAEYVAQPILNFSNRIERSTKLAGYDFLKEIQGKYDLSDAEINYMVANLAGTPNAKRKGTMTPYLNNIMLFSNIFIQGYKSHVDAYRMGRMEYVTKLAAASAAPVIAMALASAADPEWWKKVSDNNKQNYNILPLYWFGYNKYDENGKALYLRLPREELQRSIGATLWSAINPAGGNLRHSLMQAFNVWAGDVPKLAPALTAAYSTMAYGRGMNPYDYFRGREVINQRTFDRQDFETDKAFATYILNLFGFNVLYNIDTTKGLTDKMQKPSPFEYFTTIPAYGLNLPNRFLKAEDVGEHQATAKMEKEMKAQGAKELDLVDSYIEKIRSGRGDSVTTKERAAKKKHGNYFSAKIKELRNPQKAEDQHEKKVEKKYNKVFGGNK